LARAIVQPGKDSQGVADLIGRFGHDAKVEGDGSLVGGEFHGLNPATHHMQRQQDGRFPVTLSLPIQWTTPLAGPVC
jgi:hypothetical protein